MTTTRKRFTAEEDAKLRDLWHSNLKFDALVEFFPGRSADTLYDHGRRALGLGHRRVPQDFDRTLHWKTISAQLAKQPMTARQISAATGIGTNQVLDLLRRRHGSIVHVSGWSSQFTKGGASMIWALGHGEDAKKPKPMTRKQINKRYKQRLQKESPEVLDLWKQRQRIREREKAGTLIRRDVAASWI